MPKLEWLFGDPFALLLMVLPAVLPYWYVKHRGWLQAWSAGRDQSTATSRGSIATW